MTKDYINTLQQTNLILQIWEMEKEVLLLMVFIKQLVKEDEKLLLEANHTVNNARQCRI